MITENFKSVGPIKTRNERGCIIVYGTFESYKTGETFMFTAHKFKGKRFGFEYYKGRNYVAGSNENSYSRCWKNIDDVPKKYTELTYPLMDYVNREMNEMGFLK